MDDIFRDFWWLMFPLAFFLFGAWDRWLAYRRSRDELDLIKSYHAQGKEPPPELLRRVRDEADDVDDFAELPRRVQRRMYRRRYRYGWRRGAYWEWRAAVTTGVVAAAFWAAAYYEYIPGTDGVFRLVAIILTCVSAANLMFALMATAFRDRDRDPD
jgi:hypothetical protein